VAAETGYAHTTANGTGPPGTDYSYADLLAMELPPERVIIARMIGEDSGTIVGGAGGAGKSFMMLEAARAIASGTPFLGQFATTQQTVVYVDEESNLRGVVDRAKMLERGTPLGRDLPLFFEVGRGLRVEPGAGSARLDALLTRRKPGFVIADSLTRFHGANENSATEMADVFYNVKAIMRQHGCSFAFIDHHRKKGLLNDPTEMLRGASEKRNWSDGVIAVDPDDHESERSIVTVTKQRYGVQDWSFAIRRQINKEAGTARVIFDGEATKTQASKANDIIAAIHALQAQLGPDAADANTIAAWLNCSRDTIDRHAGRLVKASILAKRTIAASDKGGRRAIYDVIGGAK
jgi:predicted ATP-dependent serine protease